MPRFTFSASFSKFECESDVGGICETWHFTIFPEMNTSIAAANHIFGQRVIEGTKKNYRGKIKTIIIFLASSRDYHQFITENNSFEVPLPDQVVKELFGWLSVNTDIPKKNRRSVINLTHDADEASDNDSNEEEEVDQGDEFASKKVTMSPSCMQGYKSALKNYYGDRGARLDSVLDNWLDEFIKGYKKAIAQKKESGVMDMSEGKSSLSFIGYRSICEYMMKIHPVGRLWTWQEGLFSWLYMVLTWNLMCRSYNSAHLMLQHFDWRNDCLLIRFAKTKSDSTGEGISNEKHVYANPLTPSICPVLALAVFVWSTPRAVGDMKLFCGLSQEDRFTKILHKVLKQIPGATNLGASIKDLGCHSNRKGSTSFALNIHWISAVQVYLRAGWSLGNVQDRYIFAGAGGDQVVGRAVSGLPCNSEYFAALPPHFSSEDLILLDHVGWERILPGYSHFPCGFQRTIPFLFASLCYHHDWLRTNLSAEHPLWKQPLFTRSINEFTGNIMTVFSEKVLSGIFHCSTSGISATGIPSHLLIVSEMENLKRVVIGLTSKIELLESGLSETIQQKLDSLGTIIQEVPEQVKCNIMQNFSINGAIPLSYHDMERFLDAAIQKLSQQINISHSQMRAELENRRSGEGNILENVVGEQASNSPFTTFCWGGKMGRLVPQDFIFPNTTARTLWSLWFYGDKSRKIHPYRMLVTHGHHEDISRKQERVSLTKSSNVMTALTEIARRKGHSSSSISAMDPDRSNDLFDVAYAEFIAELYGTLPNRPLEITCDTLCNKMYKRARL
jgi:hypothetical protein